jgi:hypothetical protein
VRGDAASAKRRGLEGARLPTTSNHRPRPPRLSHIPRTRVMRAPTRGLAKALRGIYWGGGGGPSLPQRGAFAQPVACIRQDKTRRVCSAEERGCV